MNHNLMKMNTYSYTYKCETLYFIVFYKAIKEAEMIMVSMRNQTMVKSPVAEGKWIYRVYKLALKNEIL